MESSGNKSEYLAQLVREHRKAAGLSQAELAELAGVGKTAVFDLEHAKDTIRFNTILKVLSALNIKIDFSSSYLDQKRETEQ